MFALDCETLGVDLYHGVKPFFITICWDDFRQESWEFEVNPYTREVIYNPDWVKEIETEVKRVASWGKIYDRNSVEHCILGQNLKFDSGMICSIPGWTTEFPWSMAHDTLIAAHLLASNRPHDLTSLAKTYLGSIGAAMEKLEESLHQAVQKCRRKCRKDYKDWLIAEEGLTDELGNQLMPSAKGGAKKSKAGDKDKVYKYDYWLPKTIAMEEDLPFPDDNCEHEWDEEEFICKECRGHRYHTILRDYANADSASTMAIWPIMEKELKGQDLWEIYLVQMELPYIFQKMEKRGLVLNLNTLRQMESEFKEESDRLERVCVNIAKGMGYELTLPKGSRNKSLNEFVFDGLKLESEVKAGSQSMSFDKNAISHWQLTLPLRSQEKLFIDSLQAKRDRDMALSFMKAYRKFSIPLDKNHDSEIGAFYLLHPSNNQTGTDTLRTSSHNPNAQQISKLEKANLRKMICFPPGREGWSLDAQNIELRIPAYKSNEEALISVFEKPKNAPYFGSYHLVIFDLLHPELFKEHGAECKTIYESSWYQWVKNFNFCVPMDTEALTSEGWKNYDELEVGDLVAGYENESLVWIPVLNKIKFDDAQLMKIENEHFCAVSTPNHRWIGHKRISPLKGRMVIESDFTTEQITSEHIIRLSAEMYDTKTLEITADEAALIGFVFGDGTIENSEWVGGSSQALGMKVKFTVKLFQSKKQGILYIEALLQKLGIKFKKYVRKGVIGKYGQELNPVVQWIICPDRARDIWNRAGLPRDKKSADMEEFVLKLGTEERKAYLEGIWQAEGWYDGTTRVYSQNVGSFAESIKLAIFLTGKFPTTRNNAWTEFSKKQNLCIRESKSYVTGQRIKKTKVPNAPVWCIETEVGSWVMRQNGQIMLTGNSVIYGAGRKKADLTSRVPGSYDLVRKRFPGIARLSDEQVKRAGRDGFIETIPDKALKCKRGYPLWCSRTDDNFVLPTVPLNYYVQGSACWWTRIWMIECEKQLVKWREQGFDGWLVLNVHDELVFDFPFADNKANLWRIRELQKLGEKCGDRIEVPIFIGAEYHRDNWAVGEKV